MIVHPPTQARKPFRGSTSLGLLVAMLLGTVLTVGTWLIVERMEERKMEAELADHSRMCAEGFRMQLADALLPLDAIAAFHASSPRFDYAQYSTFVLPLKSKRRGLSSVDWATCVCGTDRVRFEKAMEAEGFAGFRIRDHKQQGEMVPSPNRAEYFPVQYQVPIPTGGIALGFDLGSNPVRREALEQARDTGELVATGRIVLVEETDPSLFSFLVYKPIYRPGATLASIAARREHLAGFAIAVIRVRDVIEDAPCGFRPANVILTLYDSAAPEPEQFLYQLPATDTPEARSLSATSHRGPFAKQEILMVGGRPWVLVVEPMPEFLAARRTWFSWMAAGGILAGSLLLCAYIYTLSTRNREVELLVAERTDQLSLVNQSLEASQVCLRRSEERFRTLVEHAFDGVTCYDRVGTIIYVSPNNVRLDGRTAAETLGTSGFDLIYHEDRPAAHAVLAEILANPGERITTELRVFHKDGSVRWVEAIARNLLDDVTLEAIVLNWRDITSRKRQAMLIEQTHRAARVGGWELDLATDHLTWTDETFRIHEVTPEEYTPEVQSAIAFYAPEYIPIVTEAVRQLRETGAPWESELELITGKGRRIWGHVIARTEIQGDRPVRAYGSFQDITERKIAESALHASEGRYRELLAFLPMGVYTCDTNGLITHYNQKAVEVWGRAPRIGDPSERFCGSYKLFLPNGTPLTRENSPVRTVLSTGVPAHDQEVVVERPDGSRRVVLANLAPLFGEQRAIQGAIICLLDITERKRAEEALHEARGQLERRVIERTAQLEEANTCLRREVAERRQAEEYLARNYNLLAAVTEGTSDAIYVKDLQRRYIFINTAGARHVGRPVDEVLGQDDLALFPADTAARIMASDGKILASGDLMTVEERLGADGNERVFSTTKGPYRDSAGHVVGVIGISRDITERLAVQKQLQQRVRLMEFGAAVGLALARGGSLPETLQLCTEAMIHSLDAAFARIWTLNDKEQVLELQASAGLYTHRDGPHKRIPVGQYKIGLIAESGRPLLTNDVCNDPHVSDKEWAQREGMVAFAGYPLTVERRVVGVMAVFARHSLDHAHLDAMAWVAVGIAQNIQRKWTEERIHASLHEKEALLKEIHHRVKNNLQIVNSLLSLQATKIKDPDSLQIYRESQDRVRTMALIHETLYRSGDLARIDLNDYVELLCTHLYRSYGADTTRIALTVNVAEVALDLDRAIPCGLLINELVSNALKYAFPGKRQGRLKVELLSEPASQLTLIVADDGVGLPTEFDFGHLDSLGLQLVGDLTTQLGGTLTIERAQGTLFRITIPQSATRRGPNR